ncbi:tRNA-specific 2-thiouridylase MnmA [Lachnospiraceae bacterium]|nr:tRNA-specific 2-thiouridylase MnmA [Lachnospiraceae bacterium]
MKKKVVVGMSGGVDSSVAALLLLEGGFEVIGVTMETGISTENGVSKEACQGEGNKGCCGVSAVEDAREVARTLGIPHYVMNFKKEFRENVVDYFIEEYLQGRTPNPCIACNRYVKWEALLNRSLAMGADYIATGHYARVGKLANGRFALRSSVTAGKDQTYALYSLSQRQLSRTLMPVGDYNKEEIRKLAEKNHLPVAHKPDSQDICFIPQGDYGAFIRQQVPGRVPGAGNFVSREGKVLGTHKGITHYTIGQRKGLGLAMGHPVFVSEIRPGTNEVVVSDTDVYQSQLSCHKLNFMGMEGLPEPQRLLAKVRYAHKGEWCRAERTGADEIRCIFEKPVRAVTPGQAVVFYEGEYVMGGGVILSGKE